MFDSEFCIVTKITMSFSSWSILIHIFDLMGWEGRRERRSKVGSVKILKL